MTSFNCGDIVSIRILGNGAGHEKSPRYAVVISADIINQNLQSVIVCPLIEADKNSRSRVGATFLPQTDTGLDFNCVAVSLQIKTIPKERIEKRVSSLPLNHITEIKESLQAVLDIDS